MTEQDVQRIEGAIGRPVSVAFRQFMLNPPSELGAVPELLCDADGIIEFNRSAATLAWPAHQLGLGENGCGDVYSVDLDDERGAVYLSGPHSGYESPEADGYFERAFETLHQFSQHLIRLRGGPRTGERVAPALTSDDAWQRLVGTWNYTVTSPNSRSVMRLRFTPDRKMIRSNSLSGGVLPVPMTSETTTDVTQVSVKKEDVLLTLGPNPFGGPGGVMTVRFAAANQIHIEDGPTYTREE